MKIALYLDDSALAGPERTRQILLQTFGHAPALESIVQTFLAEPDPVEVADSLVAATNAVMELDHLAAGQTALPISVQKNSPPGELPLSSPSSPSSEGNSE